MCQVQSHPHWKVWGKPGSVAVSIHTVTLRLGFFFLLPLTREHMHFVCIAQGQQMESLHSALGTEADAPSRRWIYSTNKSDLHSFLQGIRFAGAHLRAYIHTVYTIQHLAANTHWLNVYKLVWTWDTHNSSLHTHAVPGTHSHCHYIMKAALLIPGWLKFLALHLCNTVWINGGGDSLDEIL